MAAAGLQTHIWNNNLKSLMLLGLYPLLMIGLVWACSAVSTGLFIHQAPYGGPTSGQIVTGFANNVIFNYWPTILAVIIIWFIVAYFFHTRMIRALSHSKPVSRQQEPELYNLLENLSITAGIPMPRLEIIETHARNAFASGIDTKSFAVTVTRGLMNSLTKDELEAVLAHELTHILNRDVRLLMVTVIFTGMIGFAAQMFWSNIRYNFIYSGQNRNKGGGLMLLLSIALILWVGYMATLVMRFAISRNREYMADAGAVQLTKNPEAMMSALMRIAGRDKIPETTDDIAMMCFENAAPFMGLFATHPPIEKRIRALAETTGAQVPYFSIPPARADIRFTGGKANPWLVRERGARKNL